MSSMRRLELPFRGVRSHGPVDTVEARAAALALVRPEGLVLSHCTAAIVHGLPVPRQCEHDSLHVTTPGRRIRRPGVVSHRGEREPVRVRTVWVTSLADTWLDLAPSVSPDDLVVLGDAVARRMGRLDELRAVVHRRAPGVRRAREALEWIRVGSASPMETRSRVLVVRVGLPSPELNGAIHDDDGGWLATGDLVWRERRTVGEFQGAHHFAGYARGDRDIVRRRAIEGAGWAHVDFTKDDYFRRPRRLALLRRLSGLLVCDLAPAALDAVALDPRLPGAPLRGCGA